MYYNAKRLNKYAFRYQQYLWFKDFLTSGESFDTLGGIFTIQLVEDKFYLHFSELSTLELEDELERHQEPENPYYK